MPAPKNYITYWFCDTCTLHAEDGECGECGEHEHEPLWRVYENYHLAPGLPDEEHECGDIEACRQGVGNENCEYLEFTMELCEGCSVRGGPRSAYTAWSG